jgi:TetR/AcrR family fatty acid metabolism transcriptional regulator
MTDESVIKGGTMPPKIVDKESKRQEILNVALRVFARNGIANTKMTDIAREAGIGKGTIYEYFESKEDLFLGTFTLFMFQFDQRIKEFLEDESDPVKQLQGVFDLCYRIFALEAEEFGMIMMEYWAEGVRRQDEEVLGVLDLKVIYDKYRLFFIDIIRQGIQKDVFKPVDPELLASSLIALLDGLFLQFVLERSAFPLKSAYDAALDAILHGIQKRPE